MKMKLPSQLKYALVILVLGGGVLAGEYIWVKWYPYYQGYKAQKTVQLLPYHNAELGIDMQVAAGIYGRVDDFPGGVKIYRPRIFGKGPSLTITSQPNPDNSDKFSPQLLAKWETAGTYQNIPGYRFDHTRIEGRDAVLIWRSSKRAQVLPAISFSSNEGSPDLVTAHIISPDHIVAANCLTGSSHQSLYLKACESSLQTINLAGPKPQLKPEPGILELQPVKPLPAK